MSAVAPRLEIEGLAVRLRDADVLAGIDLTIEAGEIVTLTGVSGGGKTTLLRLIAGLLNPDAGAVRIDGRDMADRGPEARGIGMAFQNFALLPHLSAFDNIASPLRAGGARAPAIGQRVGEVASLLKIDHVLHHRPRELSNGQKQRTALARALARRPGVLLLDDPLRNVDAKLRYEMRLELPRLLRASGAAVLYVTQDYREAMALGDRVAVLAAGRIAQLAPSAEIYARPASTLIAQAFGEPAINLIPCRPSLQDGSATVELFGRVHALAAGAHAAIGQDCLLGLRPEDIEVSMDGASGGIEAELEAVTPLNTRTVLLLRPAIGGELFASAGEAAAATFGRGHRRVRAVLTLDRALLFERAGGTLIARAGAG